jgi:hypothetical protein
LTTGGGLCSAYRLNLIEEIDWTANKKHHTGYNGQRLDMTGRQVNVAVYSQRYVKQIWVIFALAVDSINRRLNGCDMKRA